MMLSHKTLIFLGLLAAGANAVPTANTHHLEARTQPSTLWRADDRTPAAIKTAQGFHPRNSAKHEFGLWNHLQFIFNDADTETAYVSTSSSKAFAERWAKSQFQTDLGGYSGYIYEIAPAGNMVDVDSTLREYRKEAMEEDQYEFSAIGGIPWAQIKGWQKFTTDGEQGGTFGTYEKNPSFDGTNYPKSIAAVDYALSGFPKGHAAWKKDPWKAIAATCEGASTVRPNTSTRQKRETTPHRSPKKTTASGSTLPAKNTNSKVPASGKKKATGKGRPGATSCKVPRSPKQAYMKIMKKTRGRLAGESTKVVPPKKATTPKKTTRPNRASTSA